MLQVIGALTDARVRANRMEGADNNLGLLPPFRDSKLTKVFKLPYTFTFSASLMHIVNAFYFLFFSSYFIEYTNQLLMDSLGGNCKTLMIACISPASG